MGKSERFIARYHLALVKALGKDLEKVRAKIASEIVNDWLKGSNNAQTLPETFFEALESFLGEELGFADSVSVTRSPGGFEIAVSGCKICRGNELLRAENRQGMCPIIPVGLTAARRIMKRPSHLRGVEKEAGQVGNCTIGYDLG